MTSAAAHTVLVAGTASHVGKSTVAAGLCRLLADRGVDVAPFKGQNMSNNARAVPKSVGDAGGSDAGESDAGEVGDRFGEVGVSQYVQARAARVSPETDHNPVLLKPRGDGESQLVVGGEAVAHYAAGDYFEDHWHDARDAAEAAYGRLAADHDVVVAEGAGSIAEINLQHRDLANVETARFADAEILLVADIERGGVFASLVGTLELLPDDLRDRVVGAVITKFRGDGDLLAPGLAAFEERTGVPVLGVLPYDDPGLPEEDSVALPPTGERAIHGADDGVPDEQTVTVTVPRLPRISNATDVEPLAAVPGVRVAWVPVDCGAADDPLNGVDAVVVPGTKNTVDDLLACRDGGFLDALRGFDGPVVGLCGGYQILGERIVNADVESTRETVGEESAPESGVVAGAGLLPVETLFSEEKRVVATDQRIDDGSDGNGDGVGDGDDDGNGDGDGNDDATGDADGDGDTDGAGPLTGVGRPSTVVGYEIHMGDSRLVDGVTADRVRLPFSGSERSGAALGVAVGGRDGTVGTYLHGLFENAAVREAFLDNVYGVAGKRRPAVAEERTSPYDRAADLLREHVDLAPLGLPAEE